MALSSQGASLGVRVPEPCVDLAALVTQLAAAIAPLEAVASKHPGASTAFMTWNARHRVLALDTDAVLLRLRLNPSALAAMRGFLVDAAVPRAFARAYLGGVIKSGTDAQLRAATKQLADAIDEQIDRAILDGFSPAIIASTPSATVLSELGRRLRIQPENVLRGATRIASTRIAAVGGSRDRRRDEVARIMDAIEYVDGTRVTHVANFFESLTARLASENHPQRRLEAALQFHRENAEKSTTQLGRFFDFLENEALSRVRLYVGTHIMEALGFEAQQRISALKRPSRNELSGTNADLALLASYCRRATSLIATLGAAQGPSVRLNLSADYGQNASFNLRDQIANATFVQCLPVWPEWRTQMFEELSKASSPASGPTLTRELTYHFRVNGVVPETGRHSFESRLDRLVARLGLAEFDANDSRETNVNRPLAEVVFLGAAIPDATTVDEDPDQAREAVRAIVQRLEDGGKPAIVQAIEELRARARIVQSIASAQTRLLQEKGTILTQSVAGRRWTYFLNVLPTIVDIQKIVGRIADPLAVANQGNQEQIEFLRHIAISRDQSQPGALLSIRVQVRLMERSLETVGEPAHVDIRRSLPENLIQVVWRSRETKDDTLWLVSPRVEIVYDLRTLKKHENMKKPEDFNVLAASRSALAILVHATLLRLAQRAASSAGQRVALSMLRLQHNGRDVDPLSGDEGVYAAAQAVEVALSRDVDARMQGISIGASDSASNETYKRRGTYEALFAGFPLQIHHAGDRSKIGVVTYAARPCNDHPDYPDAEGRNLILARTYWANPIEAPFSGYEVSTTGSRTEICAPDEALPSIVFEEIDQLYRRGCRHVILISHRFGQRRVGSGAAYPRLRDQGAILNRLALTHPDLAVYPLVRDIFDATRLRPRQNEDAFEILRVGGHAITAGDQDAESDVNRPSRRYQPVYSLATLHVVGGPGAQITKPQSGFCTYFLLRDFGETATEIRLRVESNLLSDLSTVRPSLLAVLRSLHYLESERATGGFVQPVFDPYDWMTPDSIGKVGEIVAQKSSRGGPGTVHLNTLALLDRTSRILHALPAPVGGRTPASSPKRGESAPSEPRAPGAS